MHHEYNLKTVSQILKSRPHEKHQFQTNVHHWARESKRLHTLYSKSLLIQWFVALSPVFGHINGL